MRSEDREQDEIETKKPRKHHLIFSYTTMTHDKEARITVYGSPISSSRLFFLGGGLSPTTERLSAKPCGIRLFRIHEVQEIE